MRRLLLLDVDGPLSPWAANDRDRPAGFAAFRLRRPDMRRSLRIWPNPAHGPALLRLADRADADLAWATSWEHLANTLIGPAIGLPKLPVIEFRAGLEPIPGRPFDWKFGAVARYATGRPLAWFDDDFDVNPAARDAFLDRRRADGLATELVRIDPKIGITDEHLARVAAWAQP